MGRRSGCACLRRGAGGWRWAMSGASKGSRSAEARCTWWMLCLYAVCCGLCAMCWVPMLYSILYGICRMLPGDGVTWKIQHTLLVVSLPEPQARVAESYGYWGLIV
ncbi:hypothetical protein BJY00DRAFT_297628 [Aspergillus carlsbadensis]|nr:hypothetical protein BJY00DRAFT_297628 [Aspergillus carlsbadensis]